MAKATSPPSAQPKRIVLLRDGTTVGCFTVRLHETHTVVLESNGHAYTHVGPSGRLSRHLTTTLLSAHREMVTAAMQFRNCYAWCVARHSLALPYVNSSTTDPTSLRRNNRQRRQHHQNHAPIVVCWPKMDVYSTKALWNDHSNLFEIHSLEGSASVQLHPSGKLVYVSYLVQVAAHEAATPVFCWTRQTFPVAQTPDCFARPVRVLLHARIARGSGADQFRVDDSGSSGDESTTCSLPHNGAFDARPTFRPSVDNRVGDRTTGDNNKQTQVLLEEISVEALARWVRSPSKSLNAWIVGEKRDDSVVFLHTTSSVLIFSDASRVDTSGGHERTNSGVPLLECDRGFFRSFGSEGSVQQQFTVETMPLELEGISPDYERTIAILQHAAELSHAVLDQLPIEPQQPIKDTVAPPPSRAANDVVEDITNDHGRFRAFADRRVRVVFADRTILQIVDDDIGSCSFTYCDGSTGRCTRDSAGPDQQRYIAIASDFAQWAFASPEQRFQRHQTQTEKAQRIARELHKITIRHKLNRVDMADGLPLESESEQPHSDGKELSAETIAQLQQETQWHMTHVQTLLNTDVDRD